MSLWESGEIISKDKLNLKTLYIGEEPPPNPVDGMVWVDTSTTPPLLKMRLNGEWHSARGAPVDKVTAPPAAESDYLTPSSASASSESGVSLVCYGNYNTPIYASQPRIGERVYAQYIYGKLISSVTFLLYKEGSPTGTVYFRIRRADNDEVYAELGSVSAEDIPSTWQHYTFTGSWPILDNVDMRFCVEFYGGDASNFIRVRRYGSNNVAWGVLSLYTTSWSDNANDDLYITISGKGLASEAKDNNTDTWWSPILTSQGEEWIQFDLGSVLAGVAGCRIYWNSDANYRPQAYKIQASVDGSTWDDLVVASSQPPAGWAEYSWVARPQTRYLRILIQQHGSSGTRVNEFDYYQSSIWRHGHRGD